MAAGRKPRSGAGILEILNMRRSRGACTTSATDAEPLEVIRHNHHIVIICGPSNDRPASPTTPVLPGFKLGDSN
jgi:hypothetical protein